MPFELPLLPYAEDALEPFISSKTLSYHYGKHHRAYVNNLNKLIAEQPSMQEKSLVDLIKAHRKTDGAIFNNAAQIWNHSFYWQGLAPKSQQITIDNFPKLTDAIAEAFGSFEAFKTQFTQKAMSTFGSGWVWLVKDHNQTLSIQSTPNAGNPMTQGDIPLLTCDVWEHAYYLDTQNDRGAYVQNFWELVNWSFVADQFDESVAST